MDYRILFAIAILVAIEIYFFKKFFRRLNSVFPHHIKVLKFVKNFFALIVNFYPLYLLVKEVIKYIDKEAPFIQLEGPFFDYVIIYPFWTIFVIMVQSILYFILIDLLYLLGKAFYWNKEKLARLNAYLTVIVGIVSVIYVPVRIVYDHYNIEVREFVFSENIPKGLDNFKITFISDFQADRFNSVERQDKYLKLVNDSNPDLVLIAGDIITSGPDYVSEASAQLGKIKTKYGVYTCIGDHDNWVYRAEPDRSISILTEALNKRNVQLLDNVNKVFNVNGNEIGVSFITNNYIERIPTTTIGNISNDLKTDLRIFLTHQPRPFLVEAAAINNYDLFLAGHTHGGQITIFFPFFNLSPTMFETKYIKGDFTYSDMDIIVCRGLGMSVAPIRYNSSPEIVNIVLKHEENTTSQK